MDLNSYFYIFSQTGVNWIDLLIFIVIIIYIIEGYASGFWASFYDFLSFVFSFVAGLSFYHLLSKLLVGYFSIPQGFANAASFFAIAFLFELIISFIIKNLAILDSEKEIGESGQTDLWNKISGIIPSVLSAVVLISFVLTMITSLPLSLFLKQSVSSSATGNILVANTQWFSKSINSIFGKAVNDTLSFLTVEPQSNETVKLNFKVKTPKIDQASENKMLDLINLERQTKGLPRLEMSYDSQKLARYYCEDMLKRGYFSHYSPEGFSPFDRMAQFDIYYTYAGENLAFAPNVQLAMRGLMQSKGHRENILSSEFKKVGIGVVDGGIYGQMYCQEFTD